MRGSAYVKKFARFYVEACFLLYIPFLRLTSWNDHRLHPFFVVCQNLHPTMPKKKQSSPKKKKTKPKQYSVEELVEAAENADPQQAISLYTLALHQLSGADDYLRRVDCLEQRGEAHVSIGNQSEACSDFQQALQVLQHCQNSAAEIAERKASLHLYIGQLSTGRDALQEYQQGIQAFQQCLEERKKNEKQVQETEKQLAQACCSVAELYLTDLCYEDNAEHECESYIQQAMNYRDVADGEPIVDVLQTIASLRISQNRGLEAVESILKVYDKMRNGCEALASLVGLKDSDNEGAAELLEMEAVQSLPGFEFRCQTSKLLLECAAILKQNSNQNQANHCVQAAIYVLGSLLAENDEVVEIWCLTGDALAALNQTQAAAHYWERTIEMLNTVKTSLQHEILEAQDEQEEDELQRQLDEVTCQLEEVSDKLSEVDREEGDDEDEAMEE